MIQNIVIAGFVAPATLPLKIVYADGVYGIIADAAVSPKNASWGALAQYPASVPVNAETFVVLKGGVGSLPPSIAYAWSGVWQQAIVLGGRVALIPVNFAAATTDFPIDITDGLNPSQILVTAQDGTVTVGSFAISATWKNTLYSKGLQYVAVEGAGMNGVAQILDSEGHSLQFTKISDEWLVLQTAAITTPGAITLTFKNGAGTTLGTTVVTVNSGNEIYGEAFFWNTGDIVSVMTSEEDVEVFASYGGSIHGGSAPQPDLFEILNQQQENFTRVIRDKLGKVIAYCPYTIMSINGSMAFTGIADEYGVISIPRSALPPRFIIQYDSVQVPLRREWITL